MLYKNKNYFMRKETTVFNDGDGVNGFCCFLSGGSTHCLANSLPCPTR